MGYDSEILTETTMTTEASAMMKPADKRVIVDTLATPHLFTLSDGR